MEKTLAKNTISNVFFRILIMGLGIFTIPVIVKAVGQEQFALMILASTVTGYFSLFGIGIPGAVVKYVAQFHAKGEKKNLSSVINTTIFIFFLIGLLIAVIVIFFINLNGLKLFNITPENYNTAKHILYIAALISIVSWPANVLGNSLEGLQKYHELNKILIFTRIIGIILTITAALSKFSIEIIFIVSNLGYFISWFMQYCYLKKSIPFWKINLHEFKVKTFKLMIHFSIWLFLMQISSVLVYQTDKIIVGAVLPVSMITVYFVLLKPIKMIRDVIYFFTMAVMPAASERYSLQGDQGMNPLIYKANRYYNAFVALICIVGVFLCAPFVNLWMGKEYLHYIWITQLYCGTLLILQSNGFLGQVFYGAGKAKKFALLGLFQAILNIILSIILVKHIGVAGVMLGTILSQIIGILCQYFIIFPDLNIGRVKYMKSVILKGQLPAICIGLVLFPFWNYFLSIDSWLELIINGFILVITLSSVSLMLVVEKQDRKTIFNLLKNKAFGYRMTS